jgi:c(7)-type cytochrome triheme protein
MKHEKRSTWDDSECAEAFMHMFSNRKGMKRNERGHQLLAVFGAVTFLCGTVSAQIDLPPAPPSQPSSYGRVALYSHASKPGSPGPVIFDHWLHRSKFTCRICHVDIGFAMTARATGITAESNRQGFHCGACHDGKRLVDGKPVFAACSDLPVDAQCNRCHSVGKYGVRKYEYNSFTAKFPKAYYGIDWQAAEAYSVIKPIDVMDGITVRKDQMQRREDFGIKAGVSWVNPVNFSHEKHSIWNGCELCHPEIFPTVKKSAVQYTMFSNLAGRHCGACHMKVAFPLNNCQLCHPRAPMWAQQ